MTSYAQKIRKAIKAASLTEYGILLTLIGTLAIFSVVSLGQNNQISLCSASQTLKSSIGLDTSGACESIASAAGNSTNIAEENDNGNDETPGGPDPMVIIMEGNSVLLNLTGVGEIDWGDGTIENFSVGAVETEFTHVFAGVGPHTVSVSGTVPLVGNMDGVTAILDFGDIDIQTLSNTFNGEDITSVAALPSTVTSLFSAFRDSPITTVTGLDAWDTTNVQVFMNIFLGASSFNQDISNWNLTNADSLHSFFMNATSFNQDISEWDTSNATIFNSMFQNADSFTADLSGWDVSSATSTVQMFRYYDGAPQDVSQWSVDNVVTFRRMFAESSQLNPNLANWNVSNAFDFRHMFQGSGFDGSNGSITGWVTTNASRMDGMFDATLFNQDISGWDVSGVSNFTTMFRNNPAFNQPIGAWTMSSASDLNRMFQGASSFDQDLSNWGPSMSGVTDFSSLFASSGFNSNVDNWDVSSGENFSTMFATTGFNRDISGWNVSNATNMNDMFRATLFNVDISGWDVTNVTSMERMFRDTSAFNQDLSGWCVTQIGSQPIEFDLSATAWTGGAGTRPQWGTCP